MVGSGLNCRDIFSSNVKHPTHSYYQYVIITYILFRKNRNVCWSGSYFSTLLILARCVADFLRTNTPNQIKLKFNKSLGHWVFICQYPDIRKHSQILASHFPLSCPCLWKRRPHAEINHPILGFFFLQKAQNLILFGVGSDRWKKMSQILTQYSNKFQNSDQMKAFPRRPLFDSECEQHTYIMSHIVAATETDATRAVLHGAYQILGALTWRESGSNLHYHWRIINGLAVSSFCRPTGRAAYFRQKRSH